MYPKSVHLIGVFATLPCTEPEHAGKDIETTAAHVNDHGIRLVLEY
jgi:hypothetical protein